MKSKILVLACLLSAAHAMRIESINALESIHKEEPAAENKEDAEPTEKTEAKEEKKDDKKEEKKLAEPVPDTPEEKLEKAQAVKDTPITKEEWAKVNPFDGLIHDKDDPSGTSASFPGGDKVNGVNFSNTYTLSHGMATNIQSKGHRDWSGTTFESHNRVETTPQSKIQDFIGSGKEMAGFSKNFEK